MKGNVEKIVEKYKGEMIEKGIWNNFDGGGSSGINPKYEFEEVSILPELGIIGGSIGMLGSVLYIANEYISSYSFF